MIVYDPSEFFEYTLYKRRFLVFWELLEVSHDEGVLRERMRKEYTITSRYFNKYGELI